MHLSMHKTWSGWTTTVEDHILFHSCQPETWIWGYHWHRLIWRLENCPVSFSVSTAMKTSTTTVPAGSLLWELKNSHSPWHQQACSPSRQIHSLEFPFNSMSPSLWSNIFMISNTSKHLAIIEITVPWNDPIPEISEKKCVKYLIACTKYRPYFCSNVELSPLASLKKRWKKDAVRCEM